MVLIKGEIMFKHQCFIYDLINKHQQLNQFLPDAYQNPEIQLVLNTTAKSNSL